MPDLRTSAGPLVSRGSTNGRKLHDRLSGLRAEIHEARDERKELRLAYDQAAELLASAPDDVNDPAYAQSLQGARDAREALEASHQRVETLDQAQIEILAAIGGPAPRTTLVGDDDAMVPGTWLSRVCLAAATTDELGSTEDLDRIFFDRLTEVSAVMSTPGVQIADIATTSVKVGKLTGRMTPAVPVAELAPIPSDDVPIGDEEIEPPKWPKLITMSLEAYRDARPLRLAAVETEMLRAIAEGFDAGVFHGAAGSAQVGLGNTTGVTSVALAGAMANLDWAADAIGSLLQASAAPMVLYLSPFTVRSLLKLKKNTDSNEPLVASLQSAASDLLGVPVRITRAVQNGHAFMVDPRTLLIVRRSDVETRVFEDYGFSNAEVGVRALARMQLVVAQPEGVVHITGLPGPTP